MKVLFTEECLVKAPGNADKIRVRVRCTRYDNDVVIIGLKAVVVNMAHMLINHMSLIGPMSIGDSTAIRIAIKMYDDMLVQLSLLKKDEEFNYTPQLPQEFRNE